MSVPSSTNIRSFSWMTIVIGYNNHHRWCHSTIQSNNHPSLSQYHLTRLSSHFRLKCPNLTFLPNVTHIWFSYDSLNSTNPIFSNQAQATFICGPKLDTYPMFCNATSVWTAMSHFMRFLRHWNAPDVTILCQRHNSALEEAGRLHLHLVILRTLLSKATYNWGIHKAIDPKEADRHRKCSQYQVSGIVPNNYKLECAASD